MSRRSAAEAAGAKLAARSMTVEELRRYLLDKAYSPAETEETLAQLLEDGYLDDARYCREYFIYARQRNKAKARIFVELRKKGVEPAVMIDAYQTFLEEEEIPHEEETARREAEKVLLAAGLTWEDPVPEKIRGRVARRLQSYGYGSSLIYDILEEMK